jgi:predicted transcriptional regulator
MTESEAAELLRIAGQRAVDRLIRLWNVDPVDYKPWTDADEAAIAAGDRDIAAGAVVSLDELRRGFSS